MTILRVLKMSRQPGLKPRRADQVIEIGAVVISSLLSLGDFRINNNFGGELVRPTITIKPEASGIHHLTDDDVVNGSPWKVVWPAYVSYMVDYYAAHNAAFDGQHITTEMLGGKQLVCTYKAALRVFPSAPNHKNQTLRYWLISKPEYSEIFESFDDELARASHRAQGDAYVTAHVLACLLLHASIEDMARWTNEPAALPTCPIGDPWRGMPWSRVDEGFLRWIVGKESMNSDYVWNAQREMDRRAEELRNTEKAKANAVAKAELDAKRTAYVDLARDAARFAVTTAALDKW